MKTIKTLMLALSTAVVITACNTNDSKDVKKTDAIASDVAQTKPPININKAMDGVPTFSTPEIQKGVEEWLTVYKEGLEEAQTKALVANGDQVKMKEIAAEMGKKFTPWKEKIAKLQAEMTADDKKKFDEYGAKIASDLVAQAQKNK